MTSGPQMFGSPASLINNNDSLLCHMFGIMCVIVCGDYMTITDGEGNCASP